MTELTIDTVMTRRFELDEAISVVESRCKAEIAPLAEELSMCENYIRSELLANGTQQWKSANTGHSTHFTTKTRCTVGDMNQVVDCVLSAATPLNGYTPEQWAGVLRHIADHALWIMFTNAVRKETVKEYIETNKAPPPGVNYSEYRDLVWSRGKA